MSRQSFENLQSGKYGPEAPDTVDVSVTPIRSSGMRRSGMMTLLFSGLTGLFFLLCTGLPVLGQDETVVTLDEAIRQTVNNHPLIREAESKVAVAVSKTDEQESMLKPVVAANLSYNRIGPVPTLEIPIPGAGSFAIATPDNLDEHVAVQYMLYDFNRRKTLIDLFRSNEATEAEKITIIKNNLAYQTVQVFYALLYLQQSMEVLNMQIKAMEEHLDVARKRVLTGSSTGLDTLTTSVRRTVLINRRMSLNNQRMKTGVLLKSLMGMPVDAAITIDGSLDSPAEEYRMDTLIQEAFLQREELRINNLVMQTQKLQQKLAEKTSVPQVNLHGSAGVKNGYPDNLNRLRPNYVLGIAIYIPIYDGQLRKLKEHTATLNLETSEKHADVLKREITTDVESTFLDYQNNQIQLKSAQQETEMASAALHQAQGLYHTGVITNTTLLDSQTDLAEARLKYTYQEYQLILSQYKLWQSIGKRIW